MARPGRKRRGGHAAEHDNDERWLLTYADMITLLMALFMVLFSISAVNISKFHTLQEALRAAFSGDILPGGKAIESPGATANASQAPPSSIDTQAIVPLTTQISTNLESATNGSTSAAQSAAAQSAASSAAQSQSSAQSQSAAQSAASASQSAASATQLSTTDLAAASREQSEFEHIKHELEAYASSHGFNRYLHIAVEAHGLVIRVLTDSLLFATGSAQLESRADPLLTEVADLLNVDQVHPVGVYGNTDDIPIQSSQYPSNWELSSARASTVVRFLAEHGVSPARLSATGYADMHPLASNATPQGRAQNRRVEVVLQRLY
ncbi:MAG TPA: flagellar motor protein MotB [Solirubrobacteraceae bacterium]|nr:flagellar motor protein MotB [Solirubrobacteraceae bacterium]